MERRKVLRRRTAFRCLPLVVLTALLVCAVERVDTVRAQAGLRVTIGPVDGRFFANPNDDGVFTATSSSVVAFRKTFPVLNFNPPSDAITCHNQINVDDSTRPFTDVQLQSGGTCSTSVAEGNGQQAGVGPLSSFNAVFTGSLTVSGAGNVTFNFYSDDGWILSLARGPSGAQPAYVSGSLQNPPKAAPFTGYNVVGALNGPSSPTRTDVTVRVPAAGIYPFELDYSECCGGALSLTMTANGQPIAAALHGGSGISLWRIISIVLVILLLLFLLLVVFRFRSLLRRS